MALTTYSELQTAIGNWIARDDLSSVIPDFITIAELNLSRMLRLFWLEKRAYSVPDGSFVALPSDYAGMRNIEWQSGDLRYSLDQITPRDMDMRYPDAQTGIPECYSIHDGQIELRPAPASDNEAKIEITYYYKPAVLSDSNTSNEFLVNCPDALLYLSLREAADYISNTEGVARWDAKAKEAINTLIGEEDQYTWPGELVMRPV